MNSTPWAVLLAGGTGTRLLSLTRRICHDERPKQFCPLLRNKTLLAQTRERIKSFIPPEKTCFAVVESHRRFYEAELADVLPSRIFVQPANRGTSPAIVYSLLRITRMDPEAIVGFFPTDHDVSDIAAFSRSVELSCDTVRRPPEFLVLTGATPDGPDSDYGWIEPGSRVGIAADAVFHVKRFLEKPSPNVASELHKNGCLLNTFVMMAYARTFVDLLRSAVPDLVQAFAPLARKHFREFKAAERIYRKLPPGDFSHQVLAACADRLLVLRLPDAGWSDLGTEERVNAVVSREGLVRAAGSTEPHNLEAFHEWLAAYRKRLNQTCQGAAPNGAVSSRK